MQLQVVKVLTRRHEKRYKAVLGQGLLSKKTFKKATEAHEYALRHAFWLRRLSLPAPEEPLPSATEADLVHEYTLPVPEPVLGADHE